MRIHVPLSLEARTTRAMGPDARTGGPGAAFTVIGTLDYPAKRGVGH